ncbi:MAG: hypothetical protein JRG97_07540 [Deltaproteobacteria bacterium]|nr:hypothetical protein [Deltaproteobacteria bacterium]MBW2140910.1 hypothetical protein [Deltaproteobacteria bacterium]MBW2322665.1 hypothetical protein [Deltaproteobacteria bacterium]
MADSKTTLERLADMAKLYRRCLKLTLETLRKDCFGDEDAVSDFFDRRIKIINKIKKLEQGLETRQEDGRNLLLGIAASEEKKAEPLLEEIQNLMTDLIESDRKLKKSLEKEVARTSLELKRVKQGHLFLKSYAPYKKGVSYYINRKG